jgi:hypothetical protein
LHPLQWFRRNSTTMSPRSSLAEGNAKGLPLAVSMSRLACALAASCLLWGQAATAAAFAAPADLARPLATELGVIHLRGHLAEHRFETAVPPATVPDELRARVETGASFTSGLLSVEDETVVLATVSIEPGTRSLTVPLSRAAVREGRATFTIRLVLAPPSPPCGAGTATCVDLDGITVSFRKVERPGAATADAWPSGLRMIEIYVPPAPSLAEAAAALMVSAFSARVASGRDVAVTVRPLESIAASPPAPSTPFSRVVVVTSDESAQARLLAAPVATVGDNWPAVVLKVPAHGVGRPVDVGSANVLPAAPKMSDHDPVPATNGAESRRWTLAQLALPPFQIRGPEQTDGEVTFSQADLGGPVSALTLHLSGTYSPTPPAPGARLMVLVNGRLVRSFGLDGSGRFLVSSAVPRAVLERDNTLTLRVSPGTARDDLGGGRFQLVVDGESSMVVERGQTLRPGFDRFPQALLPGFLVSFDQITPETLEAAGRLISAMQRTTRTPLRLEVVSWQDALASTKPWLAVAAGAVNSQSLGAPLDLAPFRLMDHDHRELIRVDGNTRLAALEAFALGVRDILLLTHRGRPHGLVSLAHDVQVQGGWYGLSGNVWLAPEGRPSFGMRLGDGGLHVEPLLASGAKGQQALRDVVLVAVLVVLAGLLVWAYPKTVRSYPRTAREWGGGAPSHQHAESRA